MTEEISRPAPSNKRLGYNIGAALMGGLATTAAGVFLPFFGESLAGVTGATLIRAPADISINAAAASYFPAQSIDSK
jgi:hypothetical protein